MAWTAPRTWVTGEVVTASILNTHIRDNQSWLSQLEIDGTALASVGAMPVGVLAGVNSITDGGSEYTTTSTTFANALTVSNTFTDTPDFLLAVCATRTRIENTAAYIIQQLSLTSGTGSFRSRQITHLNTTHEPMALVGHLYSGIGGTAFSVSLQIRTTSSSYFAGAVDTTLMMAGFKAS